MSTFTRGKALTAMNISLADMEVGESRFFTSLDPQVTVKDQIDAKTGNLKVDEQGEVLTITTLMVTDLDTGLEGYIVVGFMVAKALESIEDLTNFSFELVRGALNNRTVNWSVYPVSLS